MKRFSKTLLIVLLILINMNKIQAQSSETKLDQVELMKLFIGKWKGEFGDSSKIVCENKSFAHGIVSDCQIIIKGKTVERVTQLYGYDAETDKFIIAELKESSPVIEICSSWFTSTSTGEIIVTNPDNAPFRFKFEFKTPDMIEQIAIQDNKEVNKIVLERIKD